MKYVNSAFLFILAIAAALLYSCDSGVNIFTKSDDVQLGRQLNQQIQDEPQQYPIYTGDPSVTSYMRQRIFNNVLSSPQITDKNIYPYQVDIIDDPNTLNAFALPGGFIYVYTGLLKYLDSEAALAGVLGHEIAHVERRHATQRMTEYYGVSFLVSLVLGDNPSQLEQIATNLFVGLAFLANSRADENEADKYSFEYLRDSRYYPGGVKFFFEHMKADGLVDSNSSSIATFLSTHPDPIQRISNTDQRLQADGYPILHYTSGGDGVFRQEYIINIKDKIK